MPRPVPPALTKAAVHVYGPGTTVRVTEHGGVELEDGWHQRRLTVVEATTEDAMRVAREMLRGLPDYQGGR